METKIENWLKDIRSSKEFFDRSTRNLDEADSTFAPTPEMMTVAQQVAHVALTVEWFLEGAFSPNGIDTDFEKHAQDSSRFTSLAAARARLEKAYALAEELLKSKSDSEWEAPIGAGPIMGGEPRWSVLNGILEHTAHHRGSLAVYTRLRSKVPPMPYMDL
jgi:uncharacterized damage-inducible protein DinB